MSLLAGCMHKWAGTTASIYEAEKGHECGDELAASSLSGSSRLGFCSPKVHDTSYNMKMTISSMSLLSME